MGAYLPHRNDLPLLMGGVSLTEKLSALFEPHWKLTAAALVLFSLLSLPWVPLLGVLELVLSLVFITFLMLSVRRQRRRVEEELAAAVRELTQAGKSHLLDSPLPMVIFRPESGEVVWSNDHFLDVMDRDEHVAAVRIDAIVPEFSAQWLLDGESISPVEYSVHGKRYSVFGSLTQTEETERPLACTYWVDITQLANTRELYYATRPLVCIILIDNFEDLVRNVPDSDRSNLRADIEELLDQWVDKSNGLLCRYDRDRYLFLMEEQYLEEMKRDKFAVLDGVHKILSPNGISASLSIGIGRDGSLEEMFRYAALAIDMALSRGGDQVVIKNQFNFEFFGGRSKEQERRTKVKSRVMASALEHLIQSSPKVFVMGHRYADLDAVGAAAGICAIARRQGVDVYALREERTVPGTILVRELEQTAEYAGVFINEQQALELLEPDSLLVVVDTNRPSQVISRQLLQLCPKIAVIDHHRRAADYIDKAALTYHEPFASSASELVTELVQYLIDPGDLSRTEAEALLAGIVLDTKNFALRTGGRTFEAAAFLRRCGADTTEVRKLFQNNLEQTVMRYEVIKNAQFYRQRLAVAVTSQDVGRIVASQAADELLNVSGVDASFVVYSEDGGQNVSARSSGDINVQVILEDLGGGGNAAAAGAQIKNCSLKQATLMLHQAIDKYFEGTKEQ